MKKQSFREFCREHGPRNVPEGDAVDRLAALRIEYQRALDEGRLEEPVNSGAKEHRRGR